MKIPRTRKELQECLDCTIWEIKCKNGNYDPFKVVAKTSLSAWNKFNQQYFKDLKPSPEEWEVTEDLSKYLIK